MHNLRDKLIKVHDRMQRAAVSAGRGPASTRLLAVSKTQPASAIRELFGLGQRAFGESYVQEALAKQAQLADLGIEWHFIGPMQSNKTQAIAANFDWVHSLDRGKIAERLHRQRPADRPALNVCIQLNLDAEVSKSGVSAPEVLPLARQVLDLPRLRLRGLMAIPAPRDSHAEALMAFQRVREVLNELRGALPGVELDTLSMGMSDDMDAAIAAGATIVRVGTNLFGARPRKTDTNH